MNYKFMAFGEEFEKLINISGKITSRSFTVYRTAIQDDNIIISRKMLDAYSQDRSRSISKDFLVIFNKDGTINYERYAIYSNERNYDYIFSRFPFRRLVINKYKKISELITTHHWDMLQNYEQEVR